MYKLLLNYYLAGFKWDKYVYNTVLLNFLVKTKLILENKEVIEIKFGANIIYYKCLFI